MLNTISEQEPRWPWRGSFRLWAGLQLAHRRGTCWTRAKLQRNIGEALWNNTWRKMVNNLVVHLPCAFSCVSLYVIFYLLIKVILLLKSLSIISGLCISKTYIRSRFFLDKDNRSRCYLTRTYFRSEDKIQLNSHSHVCILDGMVLGACSD